MVKQAVKQAGRELGAGRLAWRMVLPALVLAGLALILLVVMLLAGSASGLAHSLMPLATLALVALLVILVALSLSLKSRVFTPAARLEAMLASVHDLDGQDNPASLISGLRDPGHLAGVVRHAAKLAQGLPQRSGDSRGQRESVLRTKLETVLRDLHEGVLICTLDHQVLLYNGRALEILHVTGDVGLDRPLFETMAARPFLHALTRLGARFDAGRHVDHADGLSTLLVAGTVDGHHTIQGRLSLMLDDAGIKPVGYVVTFEDVTNALSQALWRERALFDLRADIARQIAALGDAGPASRALADNMARLDGLLMDVLSGAWPMSAVFSTTLFECVAQRDSEARGLAFAVEGDPVWLTCDSASITDLLDRLANRLGVHVGTRSFKVIATLAAQGQAYLDMMYEGAPVDGDTLHEWLAEPLEPDLGAVTGADILNRHRTAFAVDRLNETTSRVRLPLPIAAERYERAARSLLPAQPRSEFYDFDLLDRPHATALEGTALRALTCVVFDTETTGLEPSKGDEIISIGAVRIVNARMLRGEIFNEFVNPQRAIPSASTKIHGITDAMVADAPIAALTLPRFHTYVGSSALIAHNAAFDMKFLAMRQADAGVRFEQPVLDTLLLAAHALGRDGNLSLDGLSQRFGVVLAPEDRHTALGDAIATGEVYLHLLPILESKGVVTLADALAASERQVGLRRMQAQF